MTTISTMLKFLTCNLLLWSILLTLSEDQMTAQAFTTFLNKANIMSISDKSNLSRRLLSRERSERSSISIRDPRTLSLAVKKSEDAIAETNEASEESLSSAWLLTLVIPLLSVYISNQWSRSSIYYLVDFSAEADPFRSFNVAIGMTEAQYGILASVAFTALFAVASLGAGIASDRYNRKTLTIISCLGWSAATLGTALSHSYNEVVGWRIAMGLAAGFSTPTAYTLINQLVPKDRISFATSLYGTGVAFGGGLASLSLLLDNQYGWQETMIIISTFGFASVGLCTALLPNDPREAQADPNLLTASKSSSEAKESSPPKAESPSSIVGDVVEAFDTTRAKWLYTGAFLRFCSGLCIGVWSAPYFRMAFPDDASSYAVAQALITGIAGSTSGIIGGAAADWISSRETSADDPVGQRLWIPVVGSLLAAPTWYMAIHADKFETAMAWLAAEYLVAECWFGPTISSLQATVGKKIGGTAQGLFTLTGAFANTAPTVLGLLYGQATGTESSSELVNLLATGVCFGYISSAVCFGLSASSSRPEPISDRP